MGNSSGIVKETMYHFSIRIDDPDNAINIDLVIAK